MSFLEEDTWYIAEKDSVTELVHVSYYPGIVMVYGYTQPIKLSEPEVIEHGEVLEYRDKEQSILFRLLTPESFAETFPKQKRTFDNTEIIQEFFWHQKDKENAVELLEENTYAFTIEDESRTVLELLQLNIDGTISFRENRQWTNMNDRDEYPTIHDLDLMFIDPENAVEAIEVWDNNESEEDGLTESDVSRYAALV